MKKRTLLLASGSVVILGLAILFITHVPQRLVDLIPQPGYIPSTVAGYTPTIV